MHYIYTINEKDFKQACFNSVQVLKPLQKKRIFFSVFFPLLLFPYIWLFTTSSIPTKILMATIAYLITSLTIYFWAYPYRLFNTESKKRDSPETWEIKEEVVLYEDRLVHSSLNIKKVVYWSDIVGSYETNTNFILYLNSQKLDFLVIKKSDGSLKTKAKELFFLTLRQKIE